jgi:hypothetical protein
MEKFEEMIYSDPKASEVGKSTGKLFTYFSLALPSWGNLEK